MQMAMENTGKDMIFDGSLKWYENVDAIMKKYYGAGKGNQKSQWKVLTQEQVVLYTNKGRQILELEREKYQRANINNDDLKWYRKIAKTGTIQDKISSCILLLNGAPVYHIKEIDLLLDVFKKTKDTKEERIHTNRKEHKIHILKSLTDLFVNNILPERKLVPINERQVRYVDGKAPCIVNDSVILSWFIEDYFKKIYRELYNIMDLFSHDPLLYVKKNIYWLSFTCLSSKVENEMAYYSLLMNGLLSSDVQIVDVVFRHIKSLLEKHSNMVKAVAEFMVRSILMDRHARNVNNLFFKTLTFLINIPFRQEHSATVNMLFTAYVNLLSKSIEGDTNHDNNDMIVKESELKNPQKAFTYLIRGINTIIGQCEYGIEFFVSNMQVLFSFLKRNEDWAKKIQVLKLLDKILSIKHTSTTDKRTDAYAKKFYNILYDAMIWEDFLSSSHLSQRLYMTIIKRTLMRDENLYRIAMFIKRILQVSHFLPIEYVVFNLALSYKLFLKNPLLFNYFITPIHQSNSDICEEIPSSRDLINTIRLSGTGLGENPDRNKKLYLYEFYPFLNHFHPAVSEYAREILKIADRVKNSRDIEKDTRKASHGPAITNRYFNDTQTHPNSEDPFHALSLTGLLTRLSGKETAKRSKKTQKLHENTPHSTRKTQ